MYKVASDKAQSGARRLKLGELAHGEQHLTDEQRRDSLKARLRAVEAQIASVPKGSPGANARRKQLGQEKFEIQEQMRAIRPKRKCPGIEQHFIDVIRESVTKAQFNAWMKIASERLAANAVTEQTEWPPPAPLTELPMRRVQWLCPRCQRLYGTESAAIACLESHGPAQRPVTNEDR